MRLVADLLARASSLLVIGQIPARCRSATSLGPVCDQDNVMEFGFNESSRPTQPPTVSGIESEYTGQHTVAVPFGWEGNRRSGMGLAMR